MRCIAAPVALALVASASLAQSVELAVDPAQSDYISEVCLLPGGLPPRCDDPGSSVGGTTKIELDSYANPTSLVLHDFRFLIQQPLHYTFDWGAQIGVITITINSSILRYGTFGVPTDPAAIDQNGRFLFLEDVDVLLSGSGVYQGSGPVFGNVGGSFELSDIGQFPSSVSGAIAIAGRTITLDLDVAAELTTDLDGIAVTIQTVADTRSLGELPCRVDLDGNGEVNTQDFLAYLNLWAAGDIAADFDDNGAVNTQDFLLFLNEWAAGC